MTNSELILYQTEDGKSRVQVRLEDETVWATQAALAELYQTSKQSISHHIRNILKDNELSEATVKEYLTVQPEGERSVNRGLKHYNLEMILAVGYRVRSHRGTQFRQWATEHLSEYLVKGFVMDDERLKEGRNLGEDYFDELLERIRDIRASEKRFYQKIRDIWKLAVDYDPKTDDTRQFFKIVQNKMHWAASGQTAAELIRDRADASKPNMGLTSWKGAKVRKGDVTTAKNYLTSEEIGHLNQIVTMYLDYAQLQAQNRKPVYMSDWQDKLDAFLRFNEQDVLTDAGRVSMTVAKKLALEEYEKYNTHRRALEAAEADVEDVEFEALASRVEKDAGDYPQ